jgi:putative two-component system response regulator
MAQTSATESRILVAADDPAAVALLRQALAADGCQVETVANGASALKCVADFRPDLILLDLEAPHTDGHEVCRQLKQVPATRLVPVIILTAQPGFQARLYAWELGADDFLTQPLRPAEVRARCRSLLDTRRLLDGLEPAEAAVFVLARTAEARSPYTHGHAGRVRDHALRLARRLGLPADQCEVLGKGALLYDVGYVNVPEAILNKPGPLTAAEFERVKEHPVEGVRIVEPLAGLRETIPLIRWHHERLDGLGYPDGLDGDSIPLPVRVLAVADVYDALASERPYRAAIPHARCLEMLVNDALNGGLDLQVVEAFCAMLTEEPPSHEQPAVPEGVGSPGA